MQPMDRTGFTKQRLCLAIVGICLLLLLVFVFGGLCVECGRRDGVVWGVGAVGGGGNSSLFLLF